MTTITSPRFSKTRRRTVVRALAASALAIAALADSAAATAATLVPEAVVRERATERWQALVAGKIDAAYQLLAPSYRAITPLKRYQDGIGGAAVWTGADVVRVSCNEPQDHCTVVVRVRTKAMLGPRLSNEVVTHVEESWVRQDGQWWLYQSL